MFTDSLPVACTTLLFLLCEIQNELLLILQALTAKCLYLNDATDILTCFLEMQHETGRTRTATTLQ